MKKTFLFLSTLLTVAFYNCNQHQSANESNKQDASNSAMDETGPARHMEGDSAVNDPNPVMNHNSKDSASTNDHMKGSGPEDDRPKKK
jgi:hypothetical protein